MYWFFVVFVLWNLKSSSGVTVLPDSIPKNVEITLLKPAGFEACIPHNDRIHKFAFFANINDFVFIPRKTNYESYVYEPSFGFWCYKNTDVKIATGDVMNYIYEVDSEELYYRSYIQTKVFRDEKVSDDGVKNINGIDLSAVPCQQKPSVYPVNQISHVYVEDTCSESLVASKKSISHLIEYNAEIEIKLRDQKLDIEKANTNLKYYKNLLSESLKIIASSLKNKTNRLRLVTQFPMTNGYLKHLIQNELGVSTKNLDYVSIQKMSPYRTEFEMASYEMKINIYLKSRLKFTGQKVKIEDVDFE